MDESAFFCKGLWRRETSLDIGVGSASLSYPFPFSMWTVLKYFLFINSTGPCRWVGFSGGETGNIS